MAGNKNQHFVPRCYLRPFTLDGEGKAINLYNLDRRRAIHRTPVKGQCSGDYFYGEDLRIERLLQGFEGDYATMLSAIRAPGYRLTDADRGRLRRFWLLQYLRTEAASRRLVEVFGTIEEDVGELPPDYRLSVKQAVQGAMSVFFNAGDTVDDLYVCLVRNRTNLPFVTSDNPAVMTNRWHLTDRRARGVSPGLGNAGMIGLLPLAPDILAVLFDSGMHALAHVDGWATADRVDDVDALNEHQALNCSANLYYRDWAGHERLGEDVSRWARQRPAARHLLHHMVFDREEAGARVFRVVSAEEAKNHTNCMLHSEAITPPPSRWPSLLKWRAGGVVYDSGTGEGFLRRDRRDPTCTYRKVRVRS